MMSLLESLSLIVIAVFLALFCYFVVVWHERRLAYEEKVVMPKQATTSPKKNKEDKRFQLAMLKLQTTLEAIVAVYIGFIAIGYTALLYFGAMEQYANQQVTAILIMILLVTFVIEYVRTKHKGFEELKKEYL